MHQCTSFQNIEKYYWECTKCGAQWKSQILANDTLQFVRKGDENGKTKKDVTKEIPA